MSCVFCKIVAGELPSEKVFEDEISLAFLDINPIRPGHTLLIPKKHFTDILEADTETLKHLAVVAQKVAQAVKIGMSAEGFNMSSNNGKAAGQDVFHMHTHIIPRSTVNELSSWPHKKYEGDEARGVGDKIRTAIGQ